MRRVALFFLSVLLLCSCADHPEAKIALFTYEDFGPPAMANELIGMDWWQWQVPEESQPTKYDIKVVVYRNVKLDAVKKEYPVAPEQFKDYRYAEYTQVMSYLDRNIQENVIESLTARLKTTKAKVIQQLGP